MDKIIFWDFNGTILNDIQLCINARNAVFCKYGANPICIDEYRKYFTFPVKNYYLNTGITEELFDKVANQWFDYYVANFEIATLNNGVEEILQYTQDCGYKNVILSASEKELLLKQIDYYNLRKYFVDILALDNIYAESKLSIAQNYIYGKDLDIIMVGDTMHDYDIAQILNARCFIYKNGHQEIDMQKANNAVVIDSLLNLKGYLR